MPSYIGYRPQFEPISLQDYLTVPMMILEGRQKEADKIEQYQNEAEKYKAMMGDSPEAQAIWNNYNNTLEGLSDDLISNKVKDLARATRRLGNSFRDIKYKAEDAKKRQDADVERFANNPSLIGSPSDFMTYYNQSGYRAPVIDSKDLATSIGSIVATEAERSPSRYIGTNPQSGLDEYIQGITPEELGISVQNAINGTPNDNISIGIKRYLDNIGYSNLSPNLQDKVKENIYKSALANSGMKKTTIDPLDRKAKQASLYGQQLSNQTKKIALEQAEENKKKYGTYEKPSLKDNETWLIDDNGNELIISRKSNSQYTVSKFENGKRVIVPSYTYQGQIYNSLGNNGIYNTSEADNLDDINPESILAFNVHDNGLFKHGLIDTKETATAEDILTVYDKLKAGQAKIVKYDNLTKGQQDAVDQVEGLSDQTYYIIQDVDKPWKMNVVRKNADSQRVFEPFDKTNDNSITSITTDQITTNPPTSVVDTARILSLPI